MLECVFKVTWSYYFFFNIKSLSISLNVWDWWWSQSQRLRPKDKSLSISLNFWDQYNKVSVSVSKFDTNFKSISLSIKNWDWLGMLGISLNTQKMVLHIPATAQSRHLYLNLVPRSAPPKHNNLCHLHFHTDFILSPSILHS